DASMLGWKVDLAQARPRRRAATRAGRRHTRTSPSGRALEKPWLLHQWTACESVPARTSLQIVRSMDLHQLKSVATSIHVQCLNACKVARLAPLRSEGIGDLAKCEIGRAACR